MAAYSPSQNGVCECNHVVVDDCVSKILEDNPELELDVALVWAINAKNAMQMVFRYSPYQLVFGVNPNLPSTLIDKPPALEGTIISEIFAKHLNALHAGRRVFIQAKTSERIHKALRHHICSLGGQFQTGDKVYYKRDNDHKWKSPGRVIGQDGKISFIRHRNVYVRVPTYRLVHVGKEFVTSEINYVNLHNTSCDTLAKEINGSDSSEDDMTGNETEQSAESNKQQDELRKQVVQPAIDTEQLRKQVVQPAIETKQSAESNKQQDELRKQVVQPAIDSTASSGSNLQSSSQQSIKKKITLPKNNQEILYHPKGSDTWIQSNVLSRGGKTTGKNWSYLNIHDKGEDQPKGIFFDRDIDEWKPVEDEVSVALTSVTTNPVHTAKCKELENWKSFNVYEEIPDEGQSTINTH